MAVSIHYYNGFGEYFGDNSIDLDFDTFRINLMTDAHVFSATDTNWADVSANEIPDGNGYTQNTKNLSSVTWTRLVGLSTFDSAITSWTAATGPIPVSGLCAHAVVFDDTSTSPSADLLVCSIDFGGNESVVSGNDFIITPNSLSGYFTLG